MQLTAFGKRMPMQVLVFPLLLFFLLSGINASAQQVTLHMKKVPLVRVLEEIKRQSGFYLVYEKSTVDKIQQVTVEVKEAPVQKVLEAALRGQPLTYTISDNVIIIKEKIAPPPSLQDQPAAQVPPIVVTGIITDSALHPLAGATISSRKSNVTTLSGADGRFSVSVPVGDVLEVTYVGYASQSIPVQPAADGSLAVQIILKPLMTSLEETVVNGIYKRPVENYTGEAKTYTVERLRDVNNINVLSALRSLDASFQLPSDINVGSDPNHLPQIQVRGANSIANTNLTSQYGYISNPPLFILDGFEVPLQKIYDLDMNRISKVTILKDAAATSIYGSKAANGVLVIETLQPKKGRLRFSYNNNLSVTTPDLSSYHLLDATQKLQLEKAAGVYTTTSALGISVQEGLDQLYNLRLAEVKRGVNTYWLSQPLHTPFAQKHSMYVDGGDDYMRYGADLSINSNPGVMKGSKRQMLSGGLQLLYHKGSLQFSNYLSVSNNKAVNSPYGSFSQYATLNPYWRATDSATGTVAKVLQSPYDPARWTTVVYNPLYNATLKTANKTGYTNITDNFQADWNIRTDLKLSARFSMYSQQNTGDVFLPADAVEFANTPDSLFSTRGYYQQTTGSMRSYQGDAFLNYGQQFGRHTLFGTAGFHLQQDRSYSNTLTVQGFPNANMDDILFGLQYPANSRPTGSESITRLMSYYANMSYAYDYRYLLDLSYRMDGSSLFGANEHFASFWSAGLGWNIHKEKFVHLPAIINRLKLRASVGSTGSQNFPAYAASQTYQYQTAYRYLDNIGVTLLSLGNNNLKWQQTNKYNVGTDIEIVKGRIQATVNYYIEKTNDLFTSVNTTPSSGFTSYFTNLGTVQNKGLELYLTVFALKQERENVYWSFYGNVLHNENRLLRISDALKRQNDDAVGEQTKTTNPITAPVLQYKEGQSVSTIYAVRSLGIDPSTGNEIFLTKDGQQTYRWSALDEVPVGDNQPTLTGNFGTNVLYQGISLNIAMRTELGGELYNNTLVDRVENANPIYNVDERVLTDRWQKPGDVAIYKGLVNLAGNTRTDITRASSRFVQKNNTLYCDAISFGYLFPAEKAKRWKMSRLQCSFYINNPFEVASIRRERGLDYPFARTYSFSLQAGF